MISAAATENLTGIILEGDYRDLSEMVDSIYRITGFDDDYDSPYWSVKNRLLGLCYDIRHAYQGDRSVKMVENGNNEGLMKVHSMIAPKENLYYSVEILFPEALFVALSAPELKYLSRQNYGSYARKRYLKTKDEFLIVNKYAHYGRDLAMIDLLSGVILSALAEVIGDGEFEKVMNLRKHGYELLYKEYAAQYVDKCNIEYIKTPLEKRKDKLRNIAKRLIKKNDSYYKLYNDLQYSAKLKKCSIHMLHDSRNEYPDDFEW